MTSSFLRGRGKFLAGFAATLSIVSIGYKLTDNISLTDEARRTLVETANGSLESSPCLYLGNEPLNKERARFINKEIVQPAISSYHVVSVTAERLADDRAIATAELVNRKGQHQKLSFIAVLTPEGNRIDVDRLIYNCWAIRGGVPTNASPFDLAPAYAAGVARDEAKLRSIGITGMLAWQMKFREWNNMEAYYRRYADEK